MNGARIHVVVKGPAYELDQWFTVASGDDGAKLLLLPRDPTIDRALARYAPSTQGDAD